MFQIVKQIIGTSRTTVQVYNYLLKYNSLSKHNIHILGRGIWSKLRMSYFRTFSVRKIDCSKYYMVRIVKNQKQQEH